jgi:response regulator of citrate/malate metabolism
MTATTPWRVLIVDDDHTDASLHRRMVASWPGFSVVATASSAEQALALYRRGVPIDLLLLDITLPGADGTRLLRALRNGTGGGPEAIVVTAGSDPEVVQTLLHLGIVDYLIKPFTVERLQQAMIRFRDRMHALSGGLLGQTDIDALCARAEQTLLPKGLRVDTLEAVRAAFRRRPGTGLTAGDAALICGVSRVTARRYLEYLVTMRQLRTEPRGEGPGRPRNVYLWIST